MGGYGPAVSYDLNRLQPGASAMDMSSRSRYRCRRSDPHCRSRHPRRIANLAVSGLIFLAVLDPGRPAHAYLDPGTGSIILQMLLGGVAGIMVVGKLYWHQFTAMFRRNPKTPEAGPESPAG